MELLIESIVVEDRVREDIGTADDWRGFKESFKKYGQLSSIKVEKQEDGRYRLVAGGRRLQALRELYAEGVVIQGLTTGHVEATVDEPQPAYKRLMKEHAENNDRKDLTFVEKAKAIRKFHEAMVEMAGGEGNGKWTMEFTARMLNLSTSSISHYLKLETAVKQDDTIAKASTLQAAVKRMRTKEKLEKRRQDVEKDGTAAVRQAEGILHFGNAIEWIKSIPDNSIDFVDFDPPWGDDVAHKAQDNHDTFDDSTENADFVMHSLLPEIYRVLKEDRFCTFWHRLWATEQMRARAESYGFNLTHTKTPCIWYKVDKVSDENRYPDRKLNEVYEAFYLLRKGDPVFHEKQNQNVFPYPRATGVIHPTQKSIEVCRAILRLTAVPGESVLVPCAGSSAMLEAALRFGCKPKGCEKVKSFYDYGITRLAEALNV